MMVIGGDDLAGDVMTDGSEDGGFVLEESFSSGGPGPLLGFFAGGW